jgi:glycosyltransferase involved in cell wall biosynthesis
MEELAPRLVAHGLEVTVFCRSHYTPPGLDEYRGVRLRTLPTLRTKYHDTPVHTLLSALALLREPFDAALLVNSANALFVPLIQLGGTPVALHVDGIERRRAKWGPLGRAVYALSERLACTLPDRLVTDAEVIRSHYRDRYGVDSVSIAYGVAPQPDAGGEVLAELGLASRRFFLYVSRFEPENNPHRVAEAYRRVGGDLPLVMLGSAPYASRFIASFTRDADPRILFPGAIYGSGYRQLLSHALAYVHATDVGGTHPALVEAMGYGNCLVVNDTPENREAAGDAAVYFRASDPSTLAARLEELRAAPETVAELAEAARRRGEERYSWEGVVSQYRELLDSMVARQC